MELVHEVCSIVNVQKCASSLILNFTALLDLPDAITFPMSPVNYTSSQTILARNIGTAPTKFTMHVKGPFEVTPTDAYLESGAMLQVEVSYKSLKAEKSQSSLVVRYNTGEELEIELTGEAEEANIRLETNSIEVDSTFISLLTVREVKIYNRSDMLVRNSSLTKV